MIVLAAATLLSLAAAGGLLLAVLHARGRRVPLPAGMGHALVALVGLAVLAIAVWQASQPVAINAALLLFAIAFIGGAFNLLFRLRHERPPGFMIVLHGGTAIVALAVLWLGILQVP